MVSLPSRYQIADSPLLGEGGMGKVILAHDRILGVPVAIKLIRPDLAQDARFRKLFHLEVRVSAQFAHPHIVPLHDHGETPDGKPYLGLAYANAGSFANFRDETPEWSQLCRLTHQLLDAHTVVIFTHDYS